MSDRERWAVANRIYAPSYISLHSAFAFYGFIPEGVFHPVSVTTRHTKEFDVTGTRYSYRRITPSRFFGYTFLQPPTSNGIGFRVMMAQPEKALLDLLYLEPGMTDALDFDGWRFDASGILETIDPQRMADYALLMRSRALMARYEKLKTWLHDNA